MGYQLTLADVYLISVLVEPFKQFLDKKTRLAKFNNLTRFMTLNLETFVFTQSYGQVVLCKKTITPPPPAPKEAAEKPIEKIIGGSEKAEKKDGGKQQKKSVEKK